jgi:hypothetical protein
MTYQTSKSGANPMVVVGVGENTVAAAVLEHNHYQHDLTRYANAATRRLRTKQQHGHHHQHYNDNNTILQQRCCDEVLKMMRKRESPLRATKNQQRVWLRDPTPVAHRNGSQRYDTTLKALYWFIPPFPFFSSLFCVVVSMSQTHFVVVVLVVVVVVV